MKTSKGNPQGWHEDTKTMMLLSDLCLVEDDLFKLYVDEYAED